MHSFSSTAPLTIVHLLRLSQDEQKFAQWFKVEFGRQVKKSQGSKEEKEK
jgi:hypothetical protein